MLPNAITVLAMCSGMSAVWFALGGRIDLAVVAVTLAGLLDGLDGRIARMLDATSRIGAELDSLADCVAFGVAPALTLYIWRLEGTNAGWIVALIFAVCMALRLARFNTLIDDTEQPPYAKEFFVGVPAPGAALLVGLPIYLELQFGPGWWSHPITVGAIMVVVAGLMVSRLPTLSPKTVRVPQRLAAVLLVGVALVFAVVITFPFLALAMVALGYLAVLPYSLHRYRWLARHPEAWDVPARQRRAVVRAARPAQRLGLRRPLRRRVADPFRTGAASLRNRRRREPLAADHADSAAAAANPRGAQPQPPSPAVGGRQVQSGKPARNGEAVRRSRRRLGLRAVRRRP